MSLFKTIFKYITYKIFINKYIPTSLENLTHENKKAFRNKQCYDRVNKTRIARYNGKKEKDIIIDKSKTGNK